MDLELRDRRALVTGSTDGIGFAIAKGLAAEGAAVVINGRKADDVERALSRLRGAVPGAKAEGVAADTAAGAEVEANFFRTARPTSLTRGFAEPEEVANLAVYVSSPRASATTGAALRVDGGVVNSIS